MKLDKAKTFIGSIVLYKVDDCYVQFTITAVKSAYGRTMFKLVPVAGKWFKWTNKVPGKDMEVVNG